MSVIKRPWVEGAIDYGRREVEVAVLFAVAIVSAGVLRLVRGDWVDEHIVLVIALTGLFALLIDYRRQWALVLWVLIPVVGIVIATYLLHPVFRLKYFGMVAPAVSILFAANLDTSRKASVVGAMLAAAMGLAWLSALNGEVVARYFQWCCIHI